MLQAASVLASAPPDTLERVAFERPVVMVHDAVKLRVAATYPRTIASRYVLRSNETGFQATTFAPSPPWARGTYHRMEKVGNYDPEIVSGRDIRQTSFSSRSFPTRRWICLIVRHGLRRPSPSTRAVRSPHISRTCCCSVTLASVTAIHALQACIRIAGVLPVAVERIRLGYRG